MTGARTRLEDTMAEGQVDGGELVKELGDSVSDLGLTEKEEAPAAPTQKDGVAGELPAQEAPAVDVAKEIVNQILDEVKTPTKCDEQEEEEAESGADHGAEVEEAHDTQGGEEEAKDNDIVKDAAKLMEKLEIAESSEGGGSGSSAAEDDRSSSLDSTANSGARPAEGEETPSDDKSDDKGVSGEESPEGFTTERPKKRIDLQHQFVRGIVKIQHDRDQYEKQCQSRKQETLKDRDASVVEPTEPTGAEEPTRADSRSSNTSSRKRYEGGKRHYSSMESGKGGQRNYHLRNALVDDSLEQQQQQHHHASRNKSEIYRPPGLRSTPTPVDRPRSVVSEAPDNVGLRITFDTEKHKRSIQLSKPSAAPSEGESNLVVTFDTTRKERHIETTGSSGRLQPQRWSDRDAGANRSQPQSWSDRSTGAAINNSNMPSDFQFKATAFGNGPSEAKVVRNSGSFRGSRPLADTGSTPKPLGDQRGFLVRNVRKEKAEDAPEKAAGTSPAPPVPAKEKAESISPALTKDKGGNVSPKSKPFAAEVKWSDIVESESELSPTSDPIFTGTPDVLESNQSNEWRSPGTNRRRGGPKKPRQKNSFRQQHQQQEQARNLQPDESPSPQASESQNSGGRRSVWERLGPRPWLDRPASVKPEPGTMASMREMAERQYLDSNSENPESAVQAAYRDSKQKRTRMELYVPRRGGG